MKKNETPSPKIAFSHDFEISLKLQVFFKENRAFCKWFKAVLVLGTDRLIRIYSSV